LRSALAPSCSRNQRSQLQVVLLALQLDLRRQAEGVLHLKALRRQLGPRQAAIAVVIGVKRYQPEMAQTRPDQSIQAFWRCVEPVDQVLQCSFKTLAGWRLEVQRFPADRPGYHLHRFIATQLADPDGA
jgi:hypothetical protein